ncbi:MAG: hypothetical protein AAGK14_12465 [Verrucomicrobiota bacterium]
MRLTRLPLFGAVFLAAALSSASAQEAAEKAPAEAKPAAAQKSAGEKKARAREKEREALAKGWRRVIIQPNGWGHTKETAVADLERVMNLYEDKPGYRRDNYVAVVYVGRNKWQADGRCSYLAPPTVKPATKERRLQRKNKSTVSGAIGSKTR